MIDTTIERDKVVRILVVDDEEIIRDVLRDALSDAGYRVKTAKNGQEAIAQIKNEPFEIIITDLIMPGMSGIELLQHVLKINQDICVLIMTAYATVESAVGAMKCGAYDYICKPFQLEEIKVAIKDAISQQQLLLESRIAKCHKHLSITDELTMLYNQRYFHVLLDHEIQRAKRYNNVLTLLLSDVDNFKQYSDLNGLLAADEVLRGLAEIFTNTVGKNNFVARYSGDEFAAILSNTNLDDSLQVAHRIMQAVRTKNWLYVNTLPFRTITISIGLACHPTDALSKEDLIARASEAMHHAKKTWKNKICYFNKNLQIDDRENSKE